MEVKLITYFIILVLILSLDYKVLFAQDISSVSREKLIFSTLNYMEEDLAANREKAVREAIQEAQLKLIEGRFVSKKEIIKKEKGLSFSNLAARTHFYLTQKTTFDDNVDSTAQKKSSLINEFTPGLKMNFRGRNKSLALDMHVDNTFYNNRSRYNSQSAEADILNNFRIGRYIFSLSDNFYDRLDDDNLGKYWKNTFKSILGRSFNRVGFDMGYKRSDYDYEPLFSYNDRTEETLTFNPYLRITKKTWTLLEYAHERKKYTHLTNPDDSHSNDLNLSLSSVLLSKLTGLAKINYKCTDNKTSGDARDTALTANIGYAPSPRSNLTFTFKHAIHEESTETGYYTKNNFKLAGSQRLAFNPKFRFSFSGETDYIDYAKKTDVSDAKNHTYTFELGLSYIFRQWLDFNLNWKHTKINSNVDPEYDKNEVKFETRLTF